MQSSFPIKISRNSLYDPNKSVHLLDFLRLRVSKITELNSVADICDGQSPTSWLYEKRYPNASGRDHGSGCTNDHHLLWFAATGKTVELSIASCWVSASMTLCSISSSSGLEELDHPQRGQRSRPWCEGKFHNMRSEQNLAGTRTLL